MCFSTLYGSNGVGTMPAGASTIITKRFQYPLRVEWCWNLEASNALYTVFSGFSTLYGSNGVGTSGLARCIIVIPGFSTLYGSNGVGTLLEHEVDHVLMYVSVPSTGRMVLEH